MRRSPYSIANILIIGLILFTCIPTMGSSFVDLPIVYATNYDIKFVEEKNDEYLQFLKQKEEEYQTFLAIKKTEYQLFLEENRSEFERVLSLLIKDFEQLNKILADDIKNLEKKYGSDPLYESKLKEYKMEIDSLNTGYALNKYQREIDPYYSGYAIDQYQREIDPYYTGHAMGLYQKEVDPYYAGFAMEQYQKEVEPYHAGYAMEQYQKEVDPYYSGYTMERYEKNKITKERAAQLIDEAKKNADAKIVATRLKINLQIETTKKTSADMIEKTKKASLQTILKQRKESLTKISNLRREYFGEGITFPSLTIDHHLNQDDIKVFINGERLEFFEQPPIMKENTVLVPLRAIFEKLGAEVTWNDKEQSVTAVKGKRKIYLKMGSTIAEVDGKKITLPVPAQKVGVHTMVPVRFVSEAFDALVKWESDTKTVFIHLKE